MIDLDRVYDCPECESKLRLTGSYQYPTFTCFPCQRTYGPWVMEHLPKETPLEHPRALYEALRIVAEQKF